MTRPRIVQGAGERIRSCRTPCSPTPIRIIAPPLEAILDVAHRPLHGLITRSRSCQRFWEERICSPLPSFSQPASSAGSVVVLTLSDRVWYIVGQGIVYGAHSNFRQIKSHATSTSPKGTRCQDNERNAAARLGFGHGKGRARSHTPAV